MDELTYIAARFIKLTRYYDLILTRDLFGWVVVKAYGRRGTQLGRMNTLPFDSKALAEVYFDKECARRLKRGYVRVHDGSGNQ